MYESRRMDTAPWLDVGGGTCLPDPPPLPPGSTTPLALNLLQLRSSQSHNKRTVNVQVGGGRAASTFRVDKLKKVSQNNTSCVDLCAGAFTEMPDAWM